MSTLSALPIDAKIAILKARSSRLNALVAGACAENAHAIANGKPQPNGAEQFNQMIFHCKMEEQQIEAFILDQER